MKGGLFDIGLLIYDLLSETIPLYSVVAELGAPAPYAVYRRAYSSEADTKDNSSYETRIGVEITVVAKSYDESIEKAKEVKHRLERIRGRWGDVMVDRVRMTNSSETYADNYVQKLIFEFDIE